MPITLQIGTADRYPRVCGHGRVRLTWHPMRNGRRHIRVTCVGCRRFLRWAPQTPYAIAEADAASAAKGGAV